MRLTNNSSNVKLGKCGPSRANFPNDQGQGADVCIVLPGSLMEFIFRAWLASSLNIYNKHNMIIIYPFYMFVCVSLVSDRLRTLLFGPEF